jgi:hypothetical protein
MIVLWVRDASSIIRVDPLAKVGFVFLSELLTQYTKDPTGPEE